MLFKDINETNNEIALETQCNPIEGITKTQNVEQAGETVFATEAVVCAEAPGSTSYFALHQDESDDSLRKILARPVLLASGALGATPGVVTKKHFRGVTDFRDAFTATQWDRLLGYTGIRFTLKLHVVISKTAFHQGVLNLCFQYGTNDDNKFRGNFFPLSVHLPCVRLNMAEETMMELAVPFVFSEEYIKVDNNLGTDIQRYGTYALVNLTGSPVVAGQSVPRYSVYVSMEDVELIGAHPFAWTTVLTQAGLNDQVHKTTQNATKRISSGAIASEAKAKGLISSSLDVASGVASAVSHVPGLGSVGGAADWFLRSASGAAEAFGFSKPIDETHPVRHVRTTYAGDGATDMPTIAYTLAAFQSNKLAVDGTVGCNDVDEMSLDYVLSKYSYIYRGNFTTSQVSGDVIYSAPVTPSAFYYRDRDLSTVGATGNVPLKISNTLTENAFLPSTLCYLGDNFRLWRGNLKFRVTFANTKLHGGRVSFGFVPRRDQTLNNTRVVPSVSALGPTVTGYNTIFDLQDASTFEFEVPFIYPAPYCSNLNAFIGDVSMIVVNPLTANATVPSTVNFMVEVCAMPGFEFAVPRPSFMAAVPATGTTVVTFQSGMSDLKVEPEASQQCIGEVIKSVKTIMMLPDYTVLNPFNNVITRANLDPWFKPNSPALASPMPTTTAALYFAAKSSRMAEMYSYVRGATLYTITRDRTNGITHTVRFEAEDGASVPVVFGSFYDYGFNIYGTAVYPECTESSRVVIPLYSSYARVPLDVRDFNFGGARSSWTQTTWSTNTTTCVPTLCIRNQNGVNARVLIGRAAADDALASQFVGPPCCIVLNFLATVNPYADSGFGAEF